MTPNTKIKLNANVYFTKDGSRFNTREITVELMPHTKDVAIDCGLDATAWLTPTEVKALISILQACVEAAQ